MCTYGPPVRVLIVPGLHDSGPEHWQTRLQRHHRHSVRVSQRDWTRADLPAWAEQIGATLAQHPNAAWVVVAHSFGCLALVRALACGALGVHAAVLVAPADPAKFDVHALLPAAALPVAATLVASRTDPWMPFDRAVRWAAQWGAPLVDAGDAGHINVQSGHGPWPLGRSIVERQIQRLNRARHLAEADARSLSYAV
jgi:predicted alpha/beta hydrolase family esterase